MRPDPDHDPNPFRVYEFKRSMMIAGAIPPAAHMVTRPRLRSRRNSPYLIDQFFSEWTLGVFILVDCGNLVLCMTPAESSSSRQNSDLHAAAAAF
jgi:hypothetical protein